MSIRYDSWRGKEFFLERCEQGRIMSHHVSALFQERSFIEVEYHKRLEKIVKFNKSSLITEHWTLGNGWNAFDTFCAREEKLRGEFISSLNNLNLESIEFKKELQNMKQTLISEIFKWEKGREKWNSELNKSKLKTDTITNDLQIILAKLNEENSSNDSKKKENSILKLQQKVSALEKDQDVATKQQKECERQHKTYLKKYQENMKKILTNLAELDARRIIGTRDLLTDFVTMSEKLYSHMLTHIASLKQNINEIDERIDVNSWIQQAINQNVDSLLRSETDTDSEAQTPQVSKEDISFSVKTTKKRKGVFVRPVKARNSDPFVKSLKSLTTDTGSNEAEGSGSDDEVTTDTEKDKKKTNIKSLFEQVSPRSDRRPVEKTDTKTDTKTEHKRLTPEPDERYDSKADRSYAIAIYDYIGQDKTELSFKRGDIINNIVTQENAHSRGVTLPNNFWIYGEINGKSGLFPLNFVEVLFKPGTKATAEHDFSPDGEDEIPLKVSDEVTVITWCGDGWLRGKNESGDIGLFPQNYVRLHSVT